MTKPETKHNFKTNIEDLDIQSVPFAATKLAKYEPTKFDLISYRKGSIDLSKIVGCDHPDYAGLTWGVLKPSTRSIYDNEDPDFKNQALKRASQRMEQLRTNSEYYLNFEQKEGWSFEEVEGKIYITGGVHRSVIGRYFFYLNGLPPIVHGVTIAKVKPKVELINTVEKNSHKPTIKINGILVFSIVMIAVALIIQ